MKQPSLKEFLEFTKLKSDEKESEKIEEEEFSAKNPEDKSSEASIMEVFYGICHIKEHIPSVVKANDDKCKAMKRIDDNQINALTKIVKSQDHRIRLLETAHKKYKEGDINEIMEINKQLYSNENRKNTNKAVNELKKSEQAVLAVENELRVWENKEEFILE